MTHVNLDTQAEVIRQFVLALTAAADGVVIESAGKPVACVVPAPKTQSIVTDGKWTEEKNRRRGELLDHKYDHELSSPEEMELALLQDAMYRYVDRVAPPPLDAARGLHLKLLHSAGQGHDANQA